MTKYYIPYLSLVLGQLAFGDCVVNLPNQIRSSADVYAVRDYIAEDIARLRNVPVKDVGVTVLSWTELEDQP